MLTFRQLREKLEYHKREGESELVHHVTTNKFSPDSFHPMSHFGTHNAARARAAFKMELRQGADKKTKFNVISARLKLGKVADISDTEHGSHYPDVLLDLISKTKHLPKKEIQNLRKKKYGLTHQHIAQALNKHGIDTLRYKNKWEDPGKTSYMITRPDQVRSVRKTKAKLNFKRGWDKLADG
jgi:DNA-binding transcriptional regulator YiaG